MEISSSDFERVFVTKDGHGVPIGTAANYSEAQTLLDNIGIERGWIEMRVSRTRFADKDGIWNDPSLDVTDLAQLMVSELNYALRALNQREISKADLPAKREAQIVQINELARRMLHNHRYSHRPEIDLNEGFTMS